MSRNVEHLQVDIRPTILNESPNRELRILIRIDGVDYWQLRRIPENDLESWLDLYFEEAKHEVKRAFEKNLEEKIIQKIPIKKEKSEKHEKHEKHKPYSRR